MTNYIMCCCIGVSNLGVVDTTICMYYIYIIKTDLNLAFLERWLHCRKPYVWPIVIDQYWQDFKSPAGSNSEVINHTIQGNSYINRFTL